MAGFFRTLALTSAALLPVYVVFRAVYRYFGRKKGLPAGGPWREILLGLFALFTAGLLVLVLQPQAGMPPAWQRLQTGQGLNFVPGATLRRFFRASGTPFHVNIVGNVAMFVPIGFCLPLFWRRWRPFRRVALVAVGFPVCVEAAQLFIGRSTDIDDVILNAAGVLLGYALCRLALVAVKRLDRLCLPRPDEGGGRKAR